jgi:RNA polymerase sigma-70 factor (ECF subfamily)
MKPSSSDISEAILIKKARQGDSQAFGVLYELYLDQIYRYVFYRVPDQVEAEDLTEIVFFKAWQSLVKIQINDSLIKNFRAWIYRIAHNEVVNFHRKNISELPLDESKNSQDQTLNPEKVVEGHERTQHLAEAISQLDPDSQQVLIFRFINQFSHDETAEIMGRTPGHVRVLQHRALKKLLSILMKERQEK